ncbi:MAG: histidine kinase dimerization/phospho-acceptor domain-containing protein, partial [Pseudomonadales bacterium]
MPARKIATRLIRWFLLIALLPLLITYGFSFSFAREHLRKEVLTNLQYIAGYKANELESYARERIQSVKALARAPGVARALYSMRWVTEKQGVNTLAYNFIDKAYRQYLTYIKEDALYEDLYLITANGDIVFSVNRDRDLGSNLFSSSYKHTQLAKAVEMALTLQQTEVSDFKHYAPINKTAAFIAAPIFFKGEVLGTVALRISNEQVFGIVNSYLGLGESGETIAIQNHNGSSFYAAPLRFDRQQAFLRSLEIDSNTSKLLENAIGRTLEDGIGKDYRDKSVIAYYRYVPSLRWDLIVKMDVEESFASIKELLQSFIIIGLLTVVFVVAATFPVASGITVPIRKLTTTTREFSNNNWQVRAEIDSEDEIGELAKGFNTMADSIQGANNQLAKYSHSLELRSAELNETLQALANSNQIKQDFLCAITHELRTPLNGILGSLELLPDLINDEDRNILDLAKESASTLMHIVDDILLFSKIQAENLQAHSNAFNLHALLHSLAQHYTHQTENKGIAFHMSRQDEVPEELVGDAYLLEVVLNHVLQNAIKFTSEGRISFVISLASKQPDDDHINIQFVISDTGIGISKKDQEMIFEIFQQVTSGFRRAFGGAGI